MRWKVGPSKDEISKRLWDALYARLSQWHDYFALIPRRCGDEYVWLETIQRKGTWIEGGYSPNYWEFEYRIPMATLLKEEAEELLKHPLPSINPQCLRQCTPCVPDGLGGCLACYDNKGGMMMKKKMPRAVCSYREIK